MAFRFRQGDRPLPGYTIERGVGRGGFGEVYYATSDGGKEVALKYLRENPQIELRGVTHCLNLKSPHLVALHDVKQNADGEFFVIMEFVSGPSLRDLLNAETAGLGSQKAAYFLREIGKGLAYLHDRGIVHRDLKPGNIFYEDGYVKIGDYGLAKIMAASQHSGQTVSVGTVHYMAPEVGSGNYDRTIDIYALGVILYEMLLGRVPFTGATMGEVLMKHLTARPEVDELPEPFPRVIRKALEKDPKDRYQTVTEMVSEVFAIGELDQSVAAFEPASLSTIAARAAGRICAPADVAAAAVHPGAGVAVGLGAGSSNVGQAVPPPIIHPGAGAMGGGRFGRLHDRISTRVGRISERIDRSPVGQQVGKAAAKPTHWFEQVAVALLVVAGLSWGYGLLIGHRAEAGLGVMTHTISVVAGVLLGGWLSLSKWKMTGRWGPRVVMAMTSGAMLLPSFGIAEGLGLCEAGGWSRAMLLSMILCDWPTRFLRGRRGEVSLGSAFSVGVFGFIAGAVMQAGNPLGVAVIAAAASLAVQAMAAIWPLRGQTGAYAPSGAQGASPTADRRDVPYAAGPAGVAVTPEGVPSAGLPPIPQSGSGSGLPTSDAHHLSRGRPDYARRSTAIRALWLLVAGLLLCTAVMAFAAPALLDSEDKDLAIGVMLGIFASSYFLFSLGCAMRRYKAGLWRGLFRPWLFSTGLATIASGGVGMGMLASRPEEEVIALGFILAGAILSLFVWLVPVPPYVPRPPVPPKQSNEKKEGENARAGGDASGDGSGGKIRNLSEVISEDELERQQRKFKKMIYAGLGLIALAVLLVPFIMAASRPHEWDQIIPPTVTPMVAAGFTVIMLGAVRSHKAKKRAAGVVRLPLRRTIEVGGIPNLSSLVEWHWTTLGYSITNKSDLLWSFHRGDWSGQFWQKDVRRWRTQVNVAGFELPDGRLRVTCYLNVDSPFNQPTPSMVAMLDGEISDFQELLVGREASSNPPEQLA